MSRRWLALFAALAFSHPAAAQEAITGKPPERIDLLAPPPAPKDEVDRSCLRKQEAATISGEIIVCGDREVSGPTYYDREKAERRYAEKTKNEGTLPTPDVAGAGIFRGPATLSGVCVPGIFNCPKPPALMIDVAALPQAPPGSDADRIARGLPPLGKDAPRTVPAPTPAEQRAELGLPEPDANGEGVNPAESATPAAPQ